ncbi:hypothetical protein UNH65_25495 [Chitinophaga sp. 180180018-2]|nr:hypothetical protein [Chitinophaga sp. 212800010-3]
MLFKKSENLIMHPIIDKLQRPDTKFHLKSGTWKLQIYYAILFFS